MLNSYSAAICFMNLGAFFTINCMAVTQANFTYILKNKFLPAFNPLWMPTYLYDLEYYVCKFQTPEHPFRERRDMFASLSSLVLELSLRGIAYSVARYSSPS